MMWNPNKVNKTLLSAEQSYCTVTNPHICLVSALTFRHPVGGGVGGEGVKERKVVSEYICWIYPAPAELRAGPVLAGLAP